jgi:hypothetical protein
MVDVFRTAASDIRRRMVRNTRIACFIGALAIHLVATGMLLGLQTSCAFPRCVEGTGFEIFSAVMRVPLFATPWLSFPSPDLDFEHDPLLFPFVLLNAVLAVTLYWGVAIVGCRVHRRWRAHQWEKLKAAHRGR